MKMTITGYQIRAAMRNLELARLAASTQFEESLTKFDDEEKLPPDEAMSKFSAAESRHAALQVLQATYNLHVEVTVGDDERTSLHDAVKMLPGANRAEKMWRDAAKPKEKSRYYGDKSSETRSVDEVYAKKTISVDECVQRASKASFLSARLKEAIQVGNATKLLLDVSPMQQEALNSIVAR